ncbi:tetratricopeptide repeat protein [Saccharothrix australiensis]|uniref:tetratricopeptide repeat protein n=1 Tax=Saccharothrix australiensis TaxID=2072 RepID=UPI001FE48884|nr:tetratricopeptide repeat protein [Saccharothrix australiensis]
MREAVALNGVGWYAARVGEYDVAREHCQAALALFRRYPDLEGEAVTLDIPGFVEHHTGHQLQAVHHYEQSLALLRTLGHTYHVAGTLADLGRAHAATPPDPRDTRS